MKIDRLLMAVAKSYEQIGWVVMEEGDRVVAINGIGGKVDLTALLKTYRDAIAQEETQK